MFIDRMLSNFLPEGALFRVLYRLHEAYETAVCFLFHGKYWQYRNYVGFQGCVCSKCWTTWKDRHPYK